MKQRQALIWIIAWSIWTILMIAQIVLAFFFHIDGIRVLKHAGWIIFAISGMFGWLPILAFRRKGKVVKGKSYIHTTALVDTGIYAIVRHPQYLAGTLINIAIILICQHWLIAAIGTAAIILNYIDMLRADQDLIGKFGEDYKRYIKAVPRMNFLLGLARLPRRKPQSRSDNGGNPNK